MTSRESLERLLKATMTEAIKEELKKHCQRYSFREGMGMVADPSGKWIKYEDIFGPTGS